MKKVFSSLLLLTLGVSAGLAQHTRYAKIPLLDDTVERTVAQATVQPWQTQLKRLQTQFTRLASRKDWQLQVPVYAYTSLSYQDKQTYLQRMLQVQQQVKRQDALSGFTFVAPVPADLAHLSPAIYETLLYFLQAKHTVRVNTYYARPFTLAAQLHGAENSALEVWLDVPGKKIYLMTDNFYSTAQAKYALHLK